MEIMLTILLITAMIGQGQSWRSYGTNFITLFPENIAYYYPLDPLNSLNITALFPNTMVEVYIAGELVYSDTPPAGTPVTVTLQLATEEYRIGYTSQTVRVSSTNFITVQSISKKGHSVQTKVIQPVKNHGSLFTIPSLNYTQMLNNFYQSARNVSKRYSSFRLIIINGDDETKYVTVVKQDKNDTYTLSRYEAVQLQTNGTEIAVYCNDRVTVMLTHPCVETEECSCNMVLNQLYPDRELDSVFIVPSILNTNNFWLHVTSSQKTEVSGADLGLTIVNGISSELLPLPTLSTVSQLITTSYPASLQLFAPGIVVEPISLNMFSACYLAIVSSTNATALIITETDYKDSVYIDGDLLSSTEWSAIPYSGYSSASVALDDAHVFWNPSAKIAVYVFEKRAHVYGGLAIPISEKPDSLGCALIPSKFDIVSTPQTWPESHQNCMEISDELFSPSNKAANVEMANFLTNDSTDERLWIGVRRSLLTLDWYQQKGNGSHDLSYTRWGTGEPGLAANGMCVSIFPNPSMDFQWEVVNCCRLLKSICYTRALYFPLYFPITDETNQKDKSYAFNASYFSV